MDEVLLKAKSYSVYQKQAEAWGTVISIRKSIQMEKKDDAKLFKDFDKTSKVTWQKKVVADLKGRGFEDLFCQIDKHLSIEPFYHSDDFERPTTPITGQKNTNDWQIGESFDIRDLKKTNTAVLAALEGGVNAPEFLIDRTLTEKDFGELFAHINPTFVAAHFIVQPGASLSKTFHNWMDFLKVKKGDTSEIKGSYVQETITINEDLMEVLHYSSEYLPEFPVLNIKCKEVESPSEELSALISKTQQQISAFQEAGFPACSLINHIQFTVSIGKDYFVEIAKLRALKLLWANLLKAYNCNPLTAPRISVHFKPSAMEEDENHNMISAATMALSAVIGGVDRLYISPAGKNNEAFSRRVARNVQHLLKMESFMDKVVDPAAGSYYIEKLTEQLGEEAWGEIGAL